MVWTTMVWQAQPQEASPARRGRPGTLMWATTTTAGTLLVTQVVYGAPPLTLTQHGTTALCLSVLWRFQWPLWKKVLAVRRQWESMSWTLSLVPTTEEQQTQL